MTLRSCLPGARRSPGPLYVGRMTGTEPALSAWELDEQLANIVDLDPDEVWKRLDAEPGDLTDLLDVADRVASVDGDITARKKDVIAELQVRCRRV